MSEHTTSVSPLNSNDTFPGEVMTRGIEAQLDLLRDRVLLLGGNTEDAVHRAMLSLTTRDSDLAQRVCEDDKQIDQMELEIDRLTVEILAFQQPAEHDLRLVVSVAKITPILERIADHATSIAEAAIILNTEPQIDSYVDFSHMAEMAAGMLREALNAFTAEDAAASREIIARVRSLLFYDDIEISERFLKARHREIEPCAIVVGGNRSWFELDRGRVIRDGPAKIAKLDCTVPK